MTAKPTPMVDVLQRLLGIFSIEQLIVIAEQAEAIRENGFGDLVVTFEKGEPKFWRRELEGWLPRKEKYATDSESRYKPGKGRHEESSE